MNTEQVRREARQTNGEVIKALEIFERKAREENPLGGYSCPACGRGPEQSENVTDRVSLPRK